jgi:hypothetical protein
MIGTQRTTEKTQRATERALRALERAAGNHTSYSAKAPSALSLSSKKRVTLPLWFSVSSQ